MTTEKMVDQIKHYFLNLQSQICDQLAQIDGYELIKDHWEYSNGKGGGLTRVLENGNVFEKAGVNFSHIQGDELPEAILKQKSHLNGYRFQAMGVSLVIHPDNPFVPTSHMNVRFFIAEKAGCEPVWWFGGGFDLTPYYGFHEDCVYWHQQAYNACKPFGEVLYTTYKQACDDYFYLPHRQEHRGIGGLFFDYLNQWEMEKCFAFTQSVGDHFTKAYLPIVQKRMNTPFEAKHKTFQWIRRGRYVEFNLVQDRGTQFGLQSGGRTESILMSMPPNVQWHYNYQPEPGSPEEKLYTDFLPAQDWLQFSAEYED